MSKRCVLSRDLSTGTSPKEAVDDSYTDCDHSSCSRWWVQMVSEFVDADMLCANSAIRRPRCCNFVVLPIAASLQHSRFGRAFL